MKVGPSGLSFLHHPGIIRVLGHPKKLLDKDGEEV